MKLSGIFNKKQLNNSREDNYTGYPPVTGTQWIRDVSFRKMSLLPKLCGRNFQHEARGESFGMYFVGTHSTFFHGIFN